MNNSLKNIFISLIILFALLLTSTIQAQVIINEFLASNVSTNPDMVDFESFSDWIEIYNTSDDEFDFGGYYVTDNLSDPFRWKVPFGTIIEPHGYLLLWADGHNDSPGNRHHRPYWPYAEFTTQRYHTNFRLNSSGEEIAIFKSEEIVWTSLISSGDEWKYSDTGEVSQFWFEVDFQDSLWQAGNSELGYGDGDESTVIGFGDDPETKHTTAYFRTQFEVDRPDRFHSISLRLKRDDGAVVYLNGIEVVRSNMPSGEIYFDTFASEVVSGGYERRWYEWDLDNELLLDCINTCAVEVHQFQFNSSDLTFNLELTGEKHSDLVLIDSISFGNQLNDVSYGRNPDDNDRWNYYGEPTPGASNDTSPSGTPELSGVVYFSQVGGFYDGRLSIEISSSDPEAEIFYTLDSTPPNSNSAVYYSPIRINETVVIKARSVESEKLLGPISTHTYFINEASSELPVVSFVVDPFLLWDDVNGIYQNNLKRREVPVDLTYYQADGEVGFRLNAGFRIGGLNIWRFPQKPLTVYARDRYGYDALNYRLFPSKSIGIFNRLVFRNGGDNWYVAMLRDGMTESIISGRLENGFQSYLPCVVYLNGSYWGIHNIREKFDPQFFESNFKVSQFGYDHLEFTFTPSGPTLMQTVEGESNSWRILHDFIESNDLADSSHYNYVKSQIDIDNFIDYAVVEQYVANTSWRHNREWWRSREANSKWMWLMPDLDRGYNPGNLDLNLFTQFKNNYILFNKLNKNTEFNQRFVNRYAAHLNSTFNPERMVGIIDSLRGNIATEMPRHIEKWGNQGGISSFPSWENSIEEIRTFVTERGAIVLDQLNEDFNLDGLSNLRIESNLPNAGQFYIEGVPMLPGFSEGLFFRNSYLKINTVPEIGYNFIGWEGISEQAEIEVLLSDELVLKAIFIKSTDNLIPNNINVNTTLRSENSPFIAIGDIEINPNVTLKIEKGVTILMPNGGSIIVRGSLTISGTQDEPVNILPNASIGATNWGAISFVEASNPSVINHAVIRGATRGDDPINLIAAISSFRSDLTLDHVLLEDVEFPIFAQFGKTTVRNSSISTDVVCDFINIKYGEALVEDCIFYGSDAVDTDAIDYDHVYNGIIRNNRIFNFTGFNSDGIDIGEQSQNILITGNVIYNSMDKGISVGQQSTVTIERNLIIGCNQGVTVKDHSSARIIQNTFYKNNYAVVANEKNIGAGGGDVDVLNSIFSNCIIDNYLVDSLSTISINYSLSDTEELPGEDNVLSDPRFIHPFIYDLELQTSSPCIDAGDPEVALDEDGTRADIGANYKYNSHDFLVIVNNSVLINEINYRSSVDFDPGDWVEIFNPSDTIVDVSNWIMKDSNEGNIFQIPTSTQISSHAYLIICRDTAKFREMFPEVVNFVGNTKFGFSSNGDRVSLYDKDSVIVDYVAYDNALPWPVDANGIGSTLELINPMYDNRLPDSWRASRESNGTPGMINSMYNIIEPIPDRFQFRQNFPNPFNRSTIIPFSIPVDQVVKISVHDITGRYISTIFNQQLNAGNYNIRWNSENLSTGMYIIRIKTDFQQAAFKVVKMN